MQLTLQDAFALASQHDAAGRRGEARAIYDEILAALPECPGALLKIAEQELQAGLPEAALSRLQRALRAAQQQSLPGHEIALLLGRVQLARGDRAAAGAVIASVLGSPAETAAVLVRLGQLALDAGEPSLAERCFRAAQQREPRDAAASAGLALALCAQGHLDAALLAAEAALEFAPTAIASFRVLVHVALARGEHAQVQAVGRRGVELYPRDVPLLRLLGRSLKDTGAAGEARKVLGECAALVPGNADILIGLGGACLDDGRPAEARQHLERAITLGAQGSDVWDNLGLACRMLGDEEQGMHAFTRALEIDPSFTPALANLVHSQHFLCEWDGVEQSEQRLAATLDDPGGDPRWSPFVAVAMPLSPAQQLAVARRWSRGLLPTPVARRPVPVRRDRLRIGYLSGNFHEHPTARLMVGLFEEHDRERFEITGYSYGPNDGSALRSRVRAACDRWRNVRDVDDAEIARLIRSDGIDVLIDRKGHTQGARLGILAHRPASVQLHYMSFPGTIGYDAIDGLIADAEVIAPGEEQFFHERVWRLPRCYYVNDRRRGLPPAAARSAQGLPEGALVLACLNNTFKLRRAFFATWMEALRSRPEAVLWLLSGHARAQANLRAEAQRQGVAADRLIFAPLLAQEAHMARVRCADLALDTLPYGAHTTGVDALWAGVPMLTCRGATFAGRVGASLLLEAGLPELITNSVAEYRERLLELVAQPALLGDYRAYLERTREHNSLFDTVGFTRDWEALLLRIYDEAAGS